MILDCECYKNYFLVSVLDTKTESVQNFEIFNNRYLFNPCDLRLLLEQNLTYSFNGFGYDLPLITLALEGTKNESLKALSDNIIGSKNSRAAVRDAGVSVPSWNHIDLIEIAPGMSGLKTYGGRLGAKRLQDLPYDSASTITPAMREELLKYCRNDLDLTRLLREALKKQIALRFNMSNQYKMDLRSKSDAQIAEAVLVSEIAKSSGKRPTRPKIKDGHTFRYKDPGFLSFKSGQLNSVFARVLEQDFGLAANGSVAIPDWLADEVIKINGARYQMGIGGLHSCEKSQYVKAESGFILEDRDVASYYPSIILGQGLYPLHLGKPFLTVYDGVVSRRLAAKRTGDKVTADTLKLCANGSYGKFGSKYSVLYSPELLIQVTLTGQFALLVLIESLVDVGAVVLSANTDGIVLHYPEALTDTVEDACFDWELVTSYVLETTRYRLIASRDVNNYVAVRTDGKIKGKGVFAGQSLAKNPDMAIIPHSVAQFLATGVEIEDTIRGCTDLGQFVTVRNVTGGAKWGGEVLGRTVRFYQSTSVPQDQAIVYAKNGNRVPKSTGARPAMDIPDTFPDDIDYRYYIFEAQKLLKEVGYVRT